MAAKFEIFRDDRGDHRFRLVAPNGEIVAQSEGYDSPTNARRGVEAVKEHALGAEIVGADE